MTTDSLFRGVQDAAAIESILDLHRLEGNTTLSVLREAWRMEEDRLEELLIEKAKSVISIGKDIDRMTAKQDEERAALAGFYHRKIEAMKTRLRLESDRVPKDEAEASEREAAE